MDDPYQPSYDPTRKLPPRGVFCAIMLVIATWLVIAVLAIMVFGCNYEPTTQQAADGEFAFLIIVFTGCVVSLTVTWVGLDWCIWEMRGAWNDMKDREWRWPEGPLYAPGKEPHHRKQRGT